MGHRRRSAAVGFPWPSTMPGRLSESRRSPPRMRGGRRRGERRWRLPTRWARDDGSGRRGYSALSPADVMRGQPRMGRPCGRHTASGGGESRRGDRSHLLPLEWACASPRANRPRRRGTVDGWESGCGVGAPNLVEETLDEAPRLRAFEKARNGAEGVLLLPPKYRGRSRDARDLIAIGEEGRLARAEARGTGEEEGMRSTNGAARQKRA